MSGWGAWAGRGGVLAVILLALAIGLTLPDIDQHLPLGGHRSGLTHAVWVPLCLVFRQRWRLVAGGLACGIAVHLIADLFPRAMIGYATIRLPLIGPLGMWSYLWIAVHAAAGLALAIWLLRPHLPPVWSSGVALLLAVALAVDYLAGDAAAIPALLLATGCGWLLLRRERARGGGASGTGVARSGMIRDWIGKLHV